MTRQAIGKKLRFSILQRDNFTCRYCGAGAPDAILHVDHVHPVALGGTNDPDNLVAACAGCNLGKRADALSLFIEHQREYAIAARCYELTRKQFPDQIVWDTFECFLDFALSEAFPDGMVAIVEGADTLRRAVAGLYEMGGYPEEFWRDA